MTDETFRRPVDWNSDVLSDVGCVRKVNEDAVLSRPEEMMWTVADGMGGHQVGDVASRKIIEALEHIRFKGQLSDYADTLENTILQVNSALVDYAKEHYNNQTMGATIVSMVIKGHVGVCMWAGDSRLYRFRNNRLEPLTRDHSQVEEMVQMGLITEAEAEVHPNKNVITRAVGVEHELFVDINVFTTQIGDTFLLCSDGLYNSVPVADIVSSLTLRSTEQCVNTLMEKSLANGAADNVSVIVVKGVPGKIT